jgi:hypothetical protein
MTGRIFPVFRCAVIANEPEVSFLENSHSPWLSRIGASGGSQRCTITIEDLLECERVGKIDFLSIDVEGHEFDILNALDFEKHHPDIIIAEYNTADIGDDFRVRDLLLAKGYQLVFQNPINMMIPWLLSIVTAIAFVALSYLGPEAMGVTIVIVVVATILRVTVFTDL